MYYGHKPRIPKCTISTIVSRLNITTIEYSTATMLGAYYMYYGHKPMIFEEKTIVTSRLTRSDSAGDEPAALPDMTRS